MKKLYSFLLAVMIISAKAQTFSNVPTTGYHYDAVAENTTAALMTTGAIDGSDYVMYSAAYGALYSTNNGLPNSGLITTNTRTYQLQPYNQNNVCYTPSGQKDSIQIVTPAPFAGISLLGFGTEGSPTFSVTLRFTDNTTVTYNAQSYPDWFNTSPTPVIFGFDRCNRTSGTPNNNTSNPRMFPLDLPISCANRVKNLAWVIITNSTSGPRVVVMAVAGASAPAFSATTIPVNCPNGTNGSAAITVTGGIAPYSYTLNTVPPQTGSMNIGLSAGVYSYTAQDGGSCAVNGTYVVTQSFVPQPALTITANQYTVCAGTVVNLSSSAAASYTWSTGSHSQQITASGSSNFTIGINGTSSSNCALSGSLTIYVNPLPVVTFTSLPAQMCVNNNAVLLTGSPSGGSFSGVGVSSNSFNPSSSGVGTYTVNYHYVDQNSCSGDASLAVTVSSLAAPGITLPAQACENDAAFQVTVAPTGGTFYGTGVSATGMFTPSVGGAGNATVNYSITTGVCNAASNGTMLINPVSPVTFSLTKNNFCINSPSITLNANPSTGTYSGNGVTGYFFSPKTAGVGTQTITYTYKNVYGCITTSKQTATVSDCTGISEASMNGETLQVYPNPAVDIVTIRAQASGQLHVYAITGQLVVNQAVNQGEEVQISGLANGVYHAVFVTGGEQVVRKIWMNR